MQIKNKLFLKKMAILKNAGLMKMLRIMTA